MIRSLHPETAGLLRRIFHRRETSWPAGLSVDVFFQETAAQGLAPLLFSKISAHDCQTWPPQLQDRLRANALSRAAVELKLEADLRALLKAFAEAGIKPLLLKGTALAYSLYPEPWLRPRSDTDLLVAETERDQAAALLLRLGCKPLIETNAEGLDSQMSYSKTAQGLRCSYDLHWQLSNTNRQFSRSFADSRQPAAPVPALGGHAWTLSRVDSLLHACFHRAGHFSHSGDRLLWLHDIHLLCQALTEIEAAFFCAKAKQLEISTLCADAITVAQSWFGTVLSKPLERLLHEKTPGEAFAILLQPGGRQVGIKNHALLELKAMPTWRARGCYLFQHAFPPSEFMLWHHGQKKKSALPLLYLKRLAEAVLIFLKR